jgi:hypothetical protein
MFDQVARAVAEIFKKVIEPRKAPRFPMKLFSLLYATIRATGGKTRIIGRKASVFEVILKQSQMRINLASELTLGSLLGEGMQQTQEQASHD